MFRTECFSLHQSMIQLPFVLLFTSFAFFFSKAVPPTCRQTIPLWLRYVDDTFTTVLKHKIYAFHDHLNELNSDILFTKDIQEDGKLSLFRLFGKPRQQRTANDSVQKTDAYRQTTWRIILQPDFTQSYDFKYFYETSATSLWHTGQLTWQKQLP